MAIQEVREGFSGAYSLLMSSLPPQYAGLLNILIFAILIALYSMFTWKFYRSLSKKDLIELNLYKYNRSSHAVFKKLLASAFYLLEYVIILPFLIFFWFAILALIILVLSEELVTSQIITVSAAIVAAIRILSYYEEDLSRDLAKMFPFTILAIFLLNPSFFDLNRIISNIAQIPSLTIHVFYFLVFIIGLELILRVLDLFISLKHSKEDEPMSYNTPSPQQ